MVQPAKDHAAILHSRCILVAFLNDHRLNTLRDRRLELPFCHLGVLLTGRTRGGGENVKLKVRVRGEELDEPISSG